MTIIFYYTTTASSSVINGRQSKMETILIAKKVEYEKRDIASSQENKEKMRELMGDPKAIAPQIFNEDQYCGNYEAFDLANEEGTLEEFLKLK